MGEQLAAAASALRLAKGASFARSAFYSAFVMSSYDSMTPSLASQDDPGESEAGHSWVRASIKVPTCDSEQQAASSVHEIR